MEVETIVRVSNIMNLNAEDFIFHVLTLAAFNFVHLELKIMLINLYIDIYYILINTLYIN